MHWQYLILNGKHVTAVNKKSVQYRAGSAMVIPIRKEKMPAMPVHSQ